MHPQPKAITKELFLLVIQDLGHLVAGICGHWDRGLGKMQLPSRDARCSTRASIPKQHKHRVQDQSVQKLMNDLDLPSDRANLFEACLRGKDGNAHNLRVQVRCLPLLHLGLCGCRLQG